MWLAGKGVVVGEIQRFRVRFRVRGSYCRKNKVLAGKIQIWCSN